jgi:hypothetical protein
MPVGGTLSTDSQGQLKDRGQYAIFTLPSGDREQDLSEGRPWDRVVHDLVEYLELSVAPNVKIPRR